MYQFLNSWQTQNPCKVELLRNYFSFSFQINASMQHVVPTYQIAESPFDIFRVII